MTDFLGFIIVKFVSVLFLVIPLRLALWIGRRLGDLAYFLNSKRRSIAYANLKSAFPEKNTCEIKKILKAHYKNLGMSVVELLKLPVMGKRYLEKYIEIEGLDRIKEARDKGKGVILLGGHFGNWEISSLGISASGQRMYIFAREQKHVRLNNLLNSYREMTGSKVVAKGFSVREIIKALRDNNVVAMLIDQDAGAKGTFVNFLNRPASMAQGPVTLGFKTGAAVIPCFMRRKDYDRHVVELYEQLQLVNTEDKEKDLKVNLESIADILEGYIRRFPEQWLWSHKRWKSSPGRTVLVLSDGKAGHLNQGMAVAEMIEEALGSRLVARGIKERPIVKIRVAEIRFKNAFARMVLDASSFFAGSRCQGCLRCLKFLLKKESFDKIKNQYADIVISCGASTVGAGIFLKYENNAKGAVIMKPGLGRNRKTDLVILPRHDAPKKIRSNMVITEAAPNRIQPGHKKGSGLGLLIGGDAKNFKLKREEVEKVINDALKIAEQMNQDIFVTTSRRTSSEVDLLLKNKLANHRCCKLLVIAKETNPEGTVKKILDSSDVVIVSPESISMISEAVSSGKYVVVFKTGSMSQGKYEKSIASLQSHGYIKIATPDEIYNTLRYLLTEKPPIKKTEDRKKITKRLEVII